jgi:hypothetical protein
MADKLHAFNLSDFEAIERRVARWHDEEFSRRPDEVVKDLALSIEKLLNALMQFDEAGLDAIRKELSSMRSEFITKQQSLGRDEYDDLRHRFFALTANNRRARYCWREISEVDYMSLLLRKVEWLESIAKHRPLSESEANEMDALPGELDACRRKLAKSAELNGKKM